MRGMERTDVELAECSLRQQLSAQPASRADVELVEYTVKQQLSLQRQRPGNGRNLRQSTRARAIQLVELENGGSDGRRNCCLALPQELVHFIQKRLAFVTTFSFTVGMFVARITLNKHNIHAFIGLGLSASICAALMPFGSAKPLRRTVFIPLVLIIFAIASAYAWIPGTQKGGFESKDPATLEQCWESTYGYLIKKCTKITDSSKKGDCEQKQKTAFWWTKARLVGYYTGFVFSTLILTAVLLKEHPPSKYARNAVHCSATLWMLDCVRWVRQIANACNTDKLGRIIMYNASFGLSYVGLIWPALLIYMRVESLQKTIDKQLYAWLLYYMNIIVLICCFFPYMTKIFVNESAHDLGNFEEMCESIARLALIIGFGVSSWTFKTLYHVLQTEARRAHGVPRSEALWAARAMKQEAIVVAAYAAMIFVCLIGTINRALTNNSGRFYMFWVTTVPYVLEAILSTTCVGVLSGVLLKYGDPSIYMTPTEERVHRAKVLETRENNNGKAKIENTQEWNDKVQRLARRGIRLGDILRFYSRLGRDLMPSYCPIRSSTNEVVRLAIIPASLDEDGKRGRALASVINDGEERLADRMVSHSWSNTFSHLVAAVVADSLEMTSFDVVLTRLWSKTGVQSLVDLLHTQGTIDNVYWICAFCVNQHAGICNSFGPAPQNDAEALADWEAKRRDSVTGQVFPLCSCLEPKYTSGDLCEMNKFDSMMEHLNCSVPPKIVGESSAFKQVIAVDPNFDIFERAWCVAELGMAYEMNIPQNMVIHSRASLEENYHKLSDLTIENCRASRIEDKQMILAKIPSLYTFDQHLQYLIFGREGLLKSWMDGPGRLANAGLVVSRALRRAAAQGSNRKNNVRRLRLWPQANSDSGHPVHTKSEPGSGGDFQMDKPMLHSTSQREMPMLHSTSGNRVLNPGSLQLFGPGRPPPLPEGSQLPSLPMTPQRTWGFAPTTPARGYDPRWDSPMIPQTGGSRFEWLVGDNRQPLDMVLQNTQQIRLNTSQPLQMPAQYDANARAFRMPFIPPSSQFS